MSLKACIFVTLLKNSRYFNDIWNVGGMVQKNVGSGRNWAKKCGRWEKWVKKMWEVGEMGEKMWEMGELES